MGSHDSTQRRFRRAAGSLVALTVLAAAAACGGDDGGSGGGSEAGTASTLRLGYFPNVTHATPVVGVAKDFFGKRLGSTKLETQTFNAGPAEIEAHARRRPRRRLHRPQPGDQRVRQDQRARRIRIIAGAHLRRCLAGRAARDQLGGGPQGQAARLAAAGQHPGRRPAGLAEAERAHPVQPGRARATCRSSRARTRRPCSSSRTGKIDGAWVPEPWASRLVLDGGGKVLVDEKTLWPGGKFVTTHLIVRTEFLEKYPARSRRCSRARSTPTSGSRRTRPRPRPR